MSYKKLEIWQEANVLSIKIHEMTLTLPKFEQFEEAQQIRTSGKSVRSTIGKNHNKQYSIHEAYAEYPESDTENQES